MQVNKPPVGGFRMWPGTELNRRHGDFQYLASSYVSVTYSDESPISHHFENHSNNVD